MRSREEIEAKAIEQMRRGGPLGGPCDPSILETLLDIRDLLAAKDEV